MPGSSATSEISQPQAPGPMPMATADTDPNDPLDFLRIVRQDIGLVNGDPLLRVELTFTSKPSRLYTVSAGTDLRNFAGNASFGTITPTDGDTTTVKAGFKEFPSRQFHRINAVRPLKR